MSFLFPRVRLRPMIADSYFQQRFRSAQPFPDSTYYYNKVKRRPAQLIRFLRLGQSTWRIPDFRRSLREKEVFFKAGKLGSEVLVGFKRGEKCRSRSSIFPRKEGGAKKNRAKVVRLLSFSRERRPPTGYPSAKRDEKQVSQKKKKGEPNSSRRKVFGEMFLQAKMSVDVTEQLRDFKSSNSKQLCKIQRYSRCSGGRTRSP